ncbi:MAG: ATP-grasp domain-containing protein, partial [Candidatus Nitrosocosmicus sp.]
MKKINVIVTSVGGIVAQGIIKSLKYHNKFSKNKEYQYNILGTDIIYDSTGLYRTDEFSIIQKPDSQQFVQNIINLCNDNYIDLLFIGSDIELNSFSCNKKKIEDRTGATLICNPSNVIEICRNKYK